MQPNATAAQKRFVQQLLLNTVLRTRNQILACRVDAQLGFFLDSNQYTHPPIDEQLEFFNVRSFEFDVYDDRPGGKFVDRPVRAILGLDDITDNSTEMRSAGMLFQFLYSTDALRMVSSCEHEKRADAHWLPVCSIMCGAVTGTAPLVPHQIRSTYGVVALPYAALDSELFLSLGLTQRVSSACRIQVHAYRQRRLRNQLQNARIVPGDH